MQLEKIVTDWYTMYCSPSKIKNLKNCAIYISYSNLQKLKSEINGIVNNHKLSEFEKEVELLNFDQIIKFIRNNNNQIESDYMQTDELEFIPENNSFIVVVKDTKNIKMLNEKLTNLEVTKEENDTLYLALIEEAQILTIKDALCNKILKYELPIFTLNIKDK